MRFKTIYPFCGCSMLRQALAVVEEKRLQDPVPQLQPREECFCEQSLGPSNAGHFKA